MESHLNHLIGTLMQIIGLALTAIFALIIAGVGAPIHVADLSRRKGG